MWTLVGLGVTVAIACAGAYFTHRSGHAKDIEELKKDLELFRDA
jgi:hypothetical protein